MVDLQPLAARLSDATGTPGEVVSVSEDGVTVAAEGGSIRLMRVRPAGQGKIAATEWAAQAGITTGTKLGS